MSNLTQNEIKHLFNYCPETGVLTWKNPMAKRVKSGDIAGHINSIGYKKVKVHGAGHLQHRIAYIFAYGDTLGDLFIDHINGNRSDNRILNLRAVDHAENCKNKRLDRRNTTGSVGVRRNSVSGKYTAQITIDKKIHFLGTFISLIEAKNARIEAQSKFQFHENHGANFSQKGGAK